MKIRFPNVAIVERVVIGLARYSMEWGEPIPDFSTRLPGRLESCLATPQQTFGGKSLYPGITNKAAILFYLMIKDHPFQNGNKRTAVMTLLYFLHENGRWLHMTNFGLYSLAIQVAKSAPKEKDLILRTIRGVLEANIESVT